MKRTSVKSSNNHTVLKCGWSRGKSTPIAVITTSISLPGGGKIGYTGLDAPDVVVMVVIAGHGIFWIAQYMYHAELLTDGQHFDDDDDETVWINLKWFAAHLKVPTKMRRSGNPNAERKAISWFKDSAREHIDKLREIAEILARHGVIVEFVKTDKPGYVLYEDEYQLFAEPFRD